MHEAEQNLFRTLAVFVGGWDLEAIEAVAAPDLDVINILGQLVDQSLVVTFEAGSEMRYRLLEPVREYTLERLIHSGEAEAVRAQHAQWYLSLAEQAHPALRSNGQVEWLHRLDLNLDNLRAALNWFLEQKQLVEAARMSFALWLFWYWRGYGQEGRSYVDAINEMTTGQAYRRLMEKANHPVLTQILRAILREESLHTNFYSRVARLELERQPISQKLARFVIDHFWEPVGGSALGYVRSNYTIAQLFGDDEGRRVIDSAVSKRLNTFPGFSGVAAINRAAEKSIQAGKIVHQMEALSAVL